MEHLWPRRVALVNRHILPQALPFPNCCQYFHLQNQEQTQQEAMLWNKAAFQRLWRLGTTSPQGVLGWVGGFGMWMFSCAWPYNCISSGLGSERMLSFSRGQALLLLMDLCAKDQRMPVVERTSSRLSVAFPLPVPGCADPE